ncbi:MAG: SGNH/GDSL hydrolase family protein [Solirubrobacteraceae bacterium]
MLSPARTTALLLSLVVALGGSASAETAVRSSTTTGRGAMREVAIAPLAPLSLAGSDATIAFDEVPLGTWVSDEYRDLGLVMTSDVFTVNDGAAETNPTLSGSPTFQGPIRGRFTAPGTDSPATVNGVSMTVGYIDSRDSVEVAGYDLEGDQVVSARAQSLGFNRVALHFRGIASFSVQRVSDEPAGFEIDDLTIERDAAGIRPGRVASIGDSYASGEGLLPEGDLHYDCATDLLLGTYAQDTTMPAGWGWVRGYDCDARTGSTERPADLAGRPSVRQQNKCHRMGRAYPNQIRQQLGVAGSGFLFVACSGATTADILRNAQYPLSPVNVAGGHPQLQTVEDFAAAGGAPDLITVGIGGNDAGFATIGYTYMTSACLEDDSFSDGVIATINGMVFRNVRDTLTRLRNDFPAATIAAFGYPAVIGDPADSCAGVNLLLWKMEESERRWLKEDVFAALNAAIADAAAEAGVTFIDITDATGGHELCTEDPYINGVRGGLADDWSPIATESFHPNQRGHDAISRYFADHFTDDGRLLFSNPEPSEPLRPPTGSEIHLGTVDGGAVESCGTDCLQPAACVQACSIHLQGAGYGPNSVLHVVLHSDPIDLGEITTDDDGRFETDLQLPAGVEPGLHDIALTGTARDGLNQYGSYPIEIFAQRPGARRPAATVEVPAAAGPPVTAPAPVARTPKPRLPLTLRIGGRRKLHLSGRRFSVTCISRPRVRCRGSARIAAGAKPIVLRDTARISRGQHTARLTFVLSPRQARRVRRALRRHGWVKANVAVIVGDARGRLATRRTVVLRR